MADSTCIMESMRDKEIKMGSEKEELPEFDICERCEAETSWFALKCQDCGHVNCRE